MPNDSSSNPSPQSNFSGPGSEPRNRATFVVGAEKAYRDERSGLNVYGTVSDRT